ncbi:MAG: hypothetical protein NW207_06595 [Cytophagales bacterium]|nr:hypothetical protein [Cytophagales bacterium]
MKKLVIILAVISGSIALCHAQCNPDPMIQKCSGKLGEFTFLKVYKIDNGKPGEPVEFSYVFSGNTNYMISLCDDKGTDTGVEISLFDSNRKLVSTNKLNGKVFPAITYSCKTTGIYYMTYTLADVNCGVSVLGFKK